LALAGRLPEIRAQVGEDLALRGTVRRRVEAVAILAACECTVKDLRTWQATVLAAAAFGSIDPPAGGRRRNARYGRSWTEVAAALGNTLAVAQASYVDPRVVTAFENGTTVAAALRRANRADSAAAQRAIIDSAVIRMLRRMR
jgi:DNA topoisomerase IB